MTRIQLSTTISAETRRKLEALLQHYGTQREAVTVAIDRLYQGHERSSNMTDQLEQAARLRVAATPWADSLPAELPGDHAPIPISGDRYQVTATIWDGNVGDTTPEEFMEGFEGDIESAVDDYIAAFPDMFGDKPPVFYWQEMCSEYTLAELLRSYLEDNLAAD